MDKVPLYNESSVAYHRRYRQIQRVKYQALAPYLQEGPLVDVGIGTGIGLSTLLRIHSVVGVDASIEMLRLARKLASAYDAGPAIVHLVCSDAAELPFRADSFSTAVSVTMLQNLMDIVRAVRELVRTTRHGGLLGITALERSLPLQKLEALTASDTTLVARLTDLASEDAGLILRRVTAKPQT